MSKFLLVSEKIIFWLLWLLVVFIPLYPKFPLVQIKGTFVSIRLEDTIVALILGLWGLYILFSGRLKEVINDKLNQSILLFYFIGLLSVFSGVYLSHTIPLNLGVLHFLRRVEFMTLLPLAMTVIRSKKQVKNLLITFSVVVLLVNLYALGQQFLKFPVVSTTNSELAKGQVFSLTPVSRVNSTFAGHYDLAIFLVMVLAVLVAVFFSLKSILLKLWSLGLLGLSFLVLVMTAARLSFVAAIIGVTFSLLLVGKKMFILVMLGLAVLAVAYPSELRDRIISTVTINVLNEGQRYTPPPTSASQLITNLTTVPIGQSSDSAEATQSAFTTAIISRTPDIAVGEPVDTTQLGVYRSFQIRWQVEWPRALRAFMINPFLGSGYSSLGLATDNDFLRSLGEVGLLGTLAFILVMVEILKRVIKNTRNLDKLLRYFSVGVLSLILAFGVNGLFIDVFEASKIAALFWIILGINLALVEVSKSE